MSVTREDVPASAHEDSTRPPLPEAEIQRMLQVLNRHRSGNGAGGTDEAVAGKSPAARPETTITLP